MKKRKRAAIMRQQPGENAFAFWARQSKKTNRELAELFEVSDVSIGYWKSGQTAPSRDRAVAIEKMTHGLVPVSSWSKS